MRVLGIDAGTTSVSLALTDGEGRFLRARTYPAEPPDRERTQDPEAMVSMVQHALRDFPDADMLAVTGQMHGILYTDASGRAVSPLYTWQNSFGDRMRSGGETYAQYAARVTGYRAASGYGLVTHLYLEEQGALPRNAEKLCTIGDYVVMRLSGLSSPVLHASNAASLGFFDLKNHRFDVRALDALGLDPGFLPEVRRKSCEAAPGVFIAVGDNQASFAGAADGDPGTILGNVGTGGQLSCLVHGCETCAHCETRPYDGDDYLLVSASLCGGRAYAVLERFFARTLETYGLHLTQEEIYEGMGRMQGSEQPPDVDTAFAGTREEPERRGCITGITDENLTPGDLVSGVLRGIAAEFLPAFRAMSEHHTFHRMALSGNAVRKNPALRRAWLELYGLPQAPDAPPEEAAAGAAKMALSQIRTIAKKGG